jgi:type I restriction enzyme M protein
MQRELLSATLEEIAAQGGVLTPGLYVSAEKLEDDGEPFEEKMARLTKDSEAEFAESSRLEAEIRENMRGLGYGV